MKPPYWRQLCAAVLLAGCGHAASLQPADPSADTACALDGMVLRDFPGAKAQVRYADGKTDYFCDVMELLRTIFAAEQARGASAQYVQDMGQADWQHPEGHWISAREALYVVGSRAEGSMGKTIVPFGRQADAQRFAAREGGRVVRFADITSDMLAMHGH